MKKRISIKGLADYMSASPTTQRRIIQSYKYPTQDESQVKIKYYAEARAAIVSFHKSADGSYNLKHEADLLAEKATNFTGRKKARVIHNVKGIRNYQKHFGEARYENIKSAKAQVLKIGGIEIFATPDIVLVEDQRTKFVKFEFLDKEPQASYINIMTRGMLAILSENYPGIKHSDIVYVDVTRGITHTAPKAGAKIQRDIEASCKNISAIWDSL